MYVTKFYSLGVCDVGVGVACSFQGRISYTAGPDVEAHAIQYLHYRRAS